MTDMQAHEKVWDYAYLVGRLQGIVKGVDARMFTKREAFDRIAAIINAVNEKGLKEGVKQ